MTEWVGQLYKYRQQPAEGCEACREQVEMLGSGEIGCSVLDDYCAANSHMETVGR